MTSYAIVQASGKQFWVEENKFYDFDQSLKTVIPILMNLTL